MSKVDTGEVRQASSVTDLNAEDKKTLVTMREIYCLGICILLGGQCTKWNVGLGAGYYEYMTMILLVGSGSVCVALCAAEMSSMLPFAGGAYGYVRCSMGPTAGFLAGFSEAIKFIMTVMTFVNQFAKRIVFMAEMPEHLAPLVFLIFYLLAVPLLVQGGKVFWYTCNLLAAFIACLLSIYCLGGAALGSLDQVTGFEDPSSSYMANMAFACLFFNGFNSVTLCCSDVKEPTKVMPRAYLLWVATAFVMAFCVLTAGVALPPGAALLVNEQFPLNPGLHYLLSISRRMVPLLVLPAVFAAGLANAFTASRQLRSMAGSGLLPSFLQRSYHGSGEATPLTATLISMLVSFLLLVLLPYCMDDMVEQIFQLRMYGSIGICLYLLRSYMIFHSRYSNLDRQFVSPLGLFGAYYGMAVFTAIFISLAFFGESYSGLIKVVVITVCAYLYYLFVARKTEFFSKEEQQKFMKAYVVNSKKGRKGRKRGPLGRLLMAVMHALPLETLGITVTSNKKKQSTSGNNARSSSNKDSVNKPSTSNQAAAAQLPSFVPVHGNVIVHPAPLMVMPDDLETVLPDEGKDDETVTVNTRLVDLAHCSQQIVELRAALDTALAV